MAAEQFPERLRAAMQARFGDDGQSALSRELVARNVRGASRGMIRNYLAGKPSPPLDFIEAAADVLGVTVGYLAAGEEQAPAPAADEPGGVTLATVFWKSIFPMVESRSLGGMPGFFARIRKAEERRLRHAFDKIALASAGVSRILNRHASVEYHAGPDSRRIVNDPRPIPAAEAISALRPVTAGLAAQVGALPGLLEHVRLKESEFDRYVSGLLLALEAVGDSAERIVGDATLADYPVEGWTDDQWLTIAKGGDDA